MVELHGKRVLIVGGGEATESPEADVLVHINNHWLKHGGQIDILYHCGSHRCRVEDLFTTLPDTCEIWIPEWTTGYKEAVEAGRRPNAITREGLWPTIMEVDYATPLTGVYAAYHLCQSKLRFLHLTAQDLYRSVPKEKWSVQVQAHNPKMQAAALYRLFQKDMRVSFCPELEAAMMYYLGENYICRGKLCPF